MIEHIIKNYEQVKVHLAKLSHDYNQNTANRDYSFAVGDLFNDSVPATPQLGGDTGGLSVAAYSQMLAREIDCLLYETNTDISRDTLQSMRYAARHWPRNKRTARCSFAVYTILASRPDRFSLIRDEMTMHEARDLVAARAPDELREERNLRKRAARLRAYNRTQTLRIGINCLRSIGANDDGTPLTGEQIALVSEAYAVLDAYCDRKGIDAPPAEAA